MHVVITGASSGIGACLAREYHRSGARVTLVARRAALLEELKRELGSRCEVVVADLGAADPTKWLAGVGPIDVFINNAGFNITAPFDAGPDGEIARLFRVDLLAPIALMRAVVPAMVARGSGACVNVSSLAGVVPPAGMTAYSAAKAGLAAYSEALHAELRGTGVHVLTVSPGPIANGTPHDSVALYGEDSVATAVPIGQAKDLAAEIRCAVERRCARLIYPRFYGLARAFPGLARWLVTKFTPPLKALPPPRLSEGT